MSTSEGFCREAADGGSCQTGQEETGPGGDRLNLLAVGLDGIPRYRKRV